MQSRSQILMESLSDNRAQDNLEPWPEPVDGSELLQEIYETLGRYVLLALSAYVVTTLWIVLTYGFELFEYSPILRITSPVRRCGKSRLLAVFARMVRRPILASSLS